MSPVEQGTVLVQLLVRLEGTCVFLLDFFLKKKEKFVLKAADLLMR